MNYVQSFIANISFPNTLEELYDFAELYNTEMILGLGYDNGVKRNTEWTAPKWCKQGDIVFFMHSKTANSRISALKTKLIEEKKSFSNDDYWYLMNGLIRAKKLHEVYGGKIFAIGKVSGSTIYDNSYMSNQHWSSKIYAPIDSIFLLEQAIDISEFNSEILVSRQSSITPVFGKQFDFLKSIVIKKNKLVEQYFYDSIAQPIPLKAINETNWLQTANPYRRSFFLEIQFRTYYVDYLLKAISESKKLYRECPCKKSNKATAFVDNVILINGKYLPVEVKLSVNAEKNIVKQLEKYCKLDCLQVDKNKEVYSEIYDNKVLVIDTDNMYVFDDNRKSLSKIYSLDDLQSVENILELQNVIISNI